MQKITQMDNTQIDGAVHGGKHPLHQPRGVVNRSYALWLCAWGKFIHVGVSVMGVYLRDVLRPKVACYTRVNRLTLVTMIPSLCLSPHTHSGMTAMLRVVEHSYHICVGAASVNIGFSSSLHNNKTVVHDCPARVAWLCNCLL